MNCTKEVRLFFLCYNHLMGIVTFHSGSAYHDSGNAVGLTPQPNVRQKEMNNEHSE